MKKLLAVIASLATLIALVVLGPRPVQKADELTGHQALAQTIKDNAPKGAHNISAAVVTKDTAEYGGIGTDENTQFEIGSVTKTFTAELMRQAVERGDVTPETKVKEIHPTDAPIGDVQLQELVNHTSGLPRLGGTSKLNGLKNLFLDTNPYEGITSEAIFESVEKQELKGRGERTYSNYGVALLGQLLAEKANKDYKTLVQEEILDPLQMSETHFTTAGEQPRGKNRAGHTAAAWDMDGYAPAGGLRSNAKDMTKFARHIMEVGAPYGWIQDDVTWHNGATGGFSSMMITSPERTVYVSGDSSAGVEKLARKIIEQTGGK